MYQLTALFVMKAVNCSHPYPSCHPHGIVPCRPNRNVSLYNSIKLGKLRGKRKIYKAVDSGSTTVCSFATTD